MTRTPSPSDLITLNNATLADAARAYASAGWPVLPLGPKDKTPLGRLAPNGLKNATTDLDIIDAWWATVPDANIGLRTGIALDVLDIDGRDAAHAISRIAPGYLHQGPVSSTGKGWHLLYQPTGSKNGAKMFGSSVDFRGQNGYIVAPPSIHPNGHAYKWARGHMLELPDAPDWLMNELFPPTPPTSRRPRIEQDGPIADTLSRLDIADEFIRAGCVLRKVGTRFHTRCIFHSDDTPSLVIYPETQSFYCFGCLAWGDALNLHAFLRTGKLR